MQGLVNSNRQPNAAASANLAQLSAVQKNFLMTEQRVNHILAQEQNLFPASLAAKPSTNYQIPYAPQAQNVQRPY